MYDIDSLPGLIELGHLNEKGVCEVEFDVTGWLTDYPTGVLSVTYIRPTETTVYPVDVTGVSIAAPTSGNLALALADEVYTLAWTVSDAVTAIFGSGSVVVELTEGGTVKKRSAKTQTYIADGHAAAGDPPEPLADYIEKWSAVDVTVTELESGEDPTGAVTQDADGTHFALGIPAGDTGQAGDTGPAPVRGVDYWTAADIAAIEDYIDTEILGGSS